MSDLCIGASAPLKRTTMEKHRKGSKIRDTFTQPFQNKKYRKMAVN